jgi:hypothetical protein
VYRDDELRRDMPRSQGRTGSQDAVGRHRILHARAFSGADDTRCSRRRAAASRTPAFDHEDDAMNYRIAIGSIALSAALCFTIAGAAAFDEAKYPDWKGQWSRLRTLRDRASPRRRR